MTRHLVVVRAGDQSRHEGWLETLRGQRASTLGVSYYGAEAGRFRDTADIYTTYRGGKWDGLAHFFAMFPDCAESFDRIWLPDDDIETTGAAIGRLFAIAAERRLELAQPSLTLDSYYSHRLTLSNRAFRLRYTNFVELMAPLMDRDLLRRALPGFAGRPTASGLDWVWPRFVRQPEDGIAIIDEIAVGHRRPLRQHLIGNLAQAGHDAEAERRATLQDFGASYVYPLAHAGITCNGRHVRLRPLVAAMMTSRYMIDRREITQQPWRWSRYVSFLYRQALARPPPDRDPA